MADSFKQASFIPKKPLDQGGVPERPRRSRSIPSFIAGLLFVLSLAAAVGAFLYERYQIAALEDRKQQLAAARDLFDPELIRELERLDRRMDIAEQLITEHVEFSPFFERLEGATLRSVRLSELEITRVEEDYRILLSGVTNSYATLALQSESYGALRTMTGIVFSDFTVDEFGNVEFTMEAGIPLSSLTP